MNILTSIRINGRKLTPTQVAQLGLDILAGPGIPWNDQKLCTVNAHDITTDPIYQRPLNQSQLKYLKNNYNPQALAVVRLAQRKGTMKLNAVDGHHQTEITKQLSEEDLVSPIMLALVAQNTTVKQEAKMFTQLNTNKPVAGNNRFRSRLVYDCDPETAILAAVESVGFDLDFALAGKGHQDLTPENAIRGVTALKTAWKQCEERFVPALRVLKGAWGKNKASGVQYKYRTGEVVYALARMLQTQAYSPKGIPSLPVVIARLSTIDLGLAMSEAVRIAAEDGKTHGTTRVTYLADYLCNVLGIASKNYRRAG
jgi:hypothetical protein